MTVGIYALITALATGLGALPFFFAKNPGRKWLSAGNAIAGGCMTGASLLLLLGGVHLSVSRTVVGAVVGILFIILTQALLKKVPHLSIRNLPKADVTKILLIVIVMTVHSFSEGVGIGVAFGNGTAFGVLIALAMAIHNIPEGLAISLVLYPRGISAWAAVGWSIFSSLPQLIAIPAFIFVEHVHAVLPAGLGFAAGAMLWMVGSELLPDALKEGRPLTIWASFVGSVLVMTLLEHYI